MLKTPKRVLEKQLNELNKKLENYLEQKVVADARLKGLRGQIKEVRADIKTYKEALKVVISQG